MRAPRSCASARCLRSARTLAASAALAALCSVAPAAAQTATALDRLEPAPPGDEFISIPSPFVPGAGRVSGALRLSYSDAPFVLRRDDGSGPEVVREVVSTQAIMHAQVAVEIAERLKLDLNIPAILTQGSQKTSADGSEYPPPDPSPRALNDIRAGARAELLRQRGLAPAAALAFSIWLPTGDETSYTGAPSLRYSPMVVAGAAYPRLVWSAAFGGRFQDTRDSLLGSELLFGAGVAARLGPVQVGPELFGSTVADGEVKVFSAEKTSIEWLLAARGTLRGFTLGAAAGTGLTRGIGSPELRLVASLSAGTDLGAYTGAQRSSFTGAQRSGRGSGRAATARAQTTAARDPATTAAPKAPVRPIPTPPPPPKPDRDGDGIPDNVDRCPTRIGGAASASNVEGCPPDRDGDGVADIDDLCPDEPGKDAPDPTRHGCLADSDGDGITDPSDACPTVKGPPDPDPKQNGCSQLIVLKAGERIVLNQRISFAFGGDVITPDSFPILTEIADLLRQHPEIARISIDGHTDNAGAVAGNVALSQRRALAVERWLLDHGVDARRMETRGFGPKQPISRDAAQNRRVEFVIRKTDLAGEPAWKEGPVE